MAWDDRLKDAAYTAPTGLRVTFIYEDVSRERTKNGASFEFPDADGTYIQELGSSGRRYPLRCIFTGANCDLEADAFEDAVFAKGTGLLEHPLYGTITVVPLGNVTRRDDLKTAANQAIVELTFFETLGIAYPQPVEDFLSSVLSAVSDFTSVIASVYITVVGTLSSIQRALLGNTVVRLITGLGSSMSTVVSSSPNTAKEFYAVVDSITTSIDTLTTTPDILASQSTIAIQTPAKSSADISDRISVYNSLLTDIISADATTSLEFNTKDLYAMSYIIGMVLSVINNSFYTRVEAIEAAEYILDKFDALIVWRDTNIGALGVVDTGESYQQLQSAVAISAGYLVDISFSLKQEHTIVLDRARTIIDVVAEVYGDIDTKLDFFIQSNNLSGSEILELQKGREVVYYV